MENEYKLGNNDEWFLKQKRKDPFTQEYFKEGDNIVLCSKCRTVMLSDAWKFYGNRCLNCKNETTIAFNSQNCEYFKKGNSSINIIGSMSNDEDEIEEEIVSTEEIEEMDKGVVFAVSLYNQAVEIIEKNEDKIKKSHKVCKSISILLVLFAVIFTGVRYNFVKEKINDKFSEESKIESIEKIEGRIEHNKEKIKDGNEKLIKKGGALGDKTEEFAKDNIEGGKIFKDKIIFSVERLILKPIEFFSNF